MSDPGTQDYTTNRIPCPLPPCHRFHAMLTCRSTYVCKGLCNQIFRNDFTLVIDIHTLLVISPRITLRNIRYDTFKDKPLDDFLNPSFRLCSLQMFPFIFFHRRDTKDTIKYREA
jgi:hypothetical protein